MVMNHTSFQEVAAERVLGRFPDFPVFIDESPDDASVLCVRVFAVPNARVTEVKAFIRHVGAELFPAGDVLLLPMVKNMDITREHYPIHMPPTSNMLAGLMSLMDDQVGHRCDWHQASSPAYGEVKYAYAGSVGMLSRSCNGDAFNAEPAPVDTKTVSMMDYALAA